MKNNPIPVALFAYARPDHLRETLEGLKRNNVSLIYAFCDGAKDETSAAKVEEVRHLIKNIEWAQVNITERETNLGLGKSIRAGITEVLKYHDKIIVIEDDIVMRPGGYEYTVAALKYFENDKRIMSVSMWTHPSITPKNAKTGFFAERFVCWGWGTYKWAWELYSDSPKEMYDKCMNRGINPEIWGKDIHWQAENAESRNLWYVGYLLTHLLFNGISFFPCEPLAMNIGRDSSAENTKRGKQDNLNKKLVRVNNFEPIIFRSQPKAIKKRFAKYFERRNRSFKSIIRYVYHKFY